jgi:methionyl-tRNA formyltransferase
MNIGFFGTPEIASFCLEKLMEKYTIAFIVTAEDKPSGRHLKIRYNQVKEIALKRGILLHQPANLRDGDFIQAIEKEKADLFVVVAYGKIIPSEIFSLPPLGTINLHPSLLPKYRGAAPMQWALINGDSETGVTVQMMDEKLDSGDILTQKRIPIHINMTSGELYKIILPLGADLLIETIELLRTNSIQPVRQNNEEATYCGRIGKNTSRIDWTKRSSEIHNLVRGLNPIPVAWTTFRGKNIRIWKTAMCAEDIESPEGGYLMVYKKKRLIVGTGDGYLEILQIQPETKKSMDALSFINGYHLQENDRFDGEG